MMSREQIYTLLMLQQRENTPFFKLPIDIIQEISDKNLNGDSKIGEALHYAAYARQEDVTALLNMLDKNPKLLLEAGSVTMPGGDYWKRVTVFEVCLGAGDFELAAKIQPYFNKIEGGEIQMRHQYKRYKPHIESLLIAKPYSLVSLFELIEKTPDEEISAPINHTSQLHQAMNQFRLDWAPRVVTKPRMQFNYISLQHAYDLLAEKWDNLSIKKIQFIMNQVIGFEMRRLPGIDRCIIAQGINAIINQNTVCLRSYRFKQEAYGFFICNSFPLTIKDEPFDKMGLGHKFGIDLGFARANNAYFCRPWGPKFSDYFNDSMPNTLKNISLRLLYFTGNTISHMVRYIDPAIAIEELKLTKYWKLGELAAPYYEILNDRHTVSLL